MNTFRRALCSLKKFVPNNAIEIQLRYEMKIPQKKYWARFLIGKCSMNDNVNARVGSRKKKISSKLLQAKSNNDKLGPCTKCPLYQ